jgi:hypothetical protein
MRDNIGAVSRVRGSDGDGGLLVAPGALNIDDRDRVTFYGNGTSTPAQVMARVIELDPALQLFHGNPHVAQYAAMYNLNTRNPGLAGRSPGQPLANLEPFHAQAGTDLKSLLAPLAERLDDLQAFVSSMPTPLGGNRKQSVATGNVRSLGLMLPLGDP